MPVVVLRGRRVDREEGSVDDASRDGRGGTPSRETRSPARVRLVLGPVRGGRAGDADGPLVVTPNPRAARACGVRPVSLERLARELLRSMGVQIAPELTRWRALRSAVLRVVSPSDLEGTARALRPTLREVLRAGLPGAGTVATGRLARVLEVAQRYRQDLAARALVDPAEALWWVVRGGLEGTPPARRRLEVLGYPRLGAAEVAFLEAVCAPGSALELPVGEHPVFEDNRAVVAALRAAGWEIGASPQAAGSGSARAGAVTDGVAADAAASEGAASDRASGPAADSARAPARALRFPSREAEVRFVLTEVKRLLARAVPVEAIALVARDDAAYGPLLRAVAWEYQVPVVLSYAVPLRQTPVGAWTATLLEAVREGLPFEAVARLLAHPLTLGAPPQHPDSGWWELARARHPHGVQAWTELEVRAEALAWPERALRRDLLGRLQDAWERFGVSARAQARPADAVAWQRLAASAAGLGLPPDEEVPLGVFLHELDALLALLDVPADVGRRGVELHTPLALFGARYPHLFVLGVSEGELPQRLVDDPVLDFHQRRAAAAAGLVLESAAQAARREALSFRALLWAHAADVAGATLTLSFAEDRGIASPYLAELGLTPGPPPSKPPASPEEVRRRRILVDDGGAADPVLAFARRAWSVERHREEAAAPDAFDGVVGEPYPLAAHVFSATQLLELGQCPFRWLCRVPLGLSAPDEAEEDMSPLLRGRLYHRALELTLAAALRSTGEGAPAQALREAAVAALEDAFQTAEQEQGATAVAGWELRRGQHLEQLRRVLASDSFLPDGTEVVALERAFPERGGPPAMWRGLRVRGKIDRIDRRGGGLVLLDYKTRGSRAAGAQDERGKARVDVQLPLYLEAAATALFGGERVAGAQYYSLTKAEVLQEVRLDDGLDRAIDGVIERSRARLAAGSYPVAPDADLRACATCDFDLICRKGPRTERMRSADAFAAGAAGPPREGER